MKAAVLVALCLIVSACAGTPPINAEQLATVTKENNASVGCATGTGPWGRAGVVFVNAQNANVVSGRVSVNTDCTIQIDAVAPGVPQVVTSTTIAPAPAPVAQPAPAK